MYAVIDAGGKQARVEVGSLVELELLPQGPGDEVALRPVLVVDGEEVYAGPSALESASVSGRVVGEAKGPKVVGFTYKPKARRRRRFGHRQRYTTVEVTAIAPGEPAGPGGRPGSARPRH
jgi:large subunit ribosomal protein L21